MRTIRTGVRGELLVPRHRVLRGLGIRGATSQEVLP